MDLRNRKLFDFSDGPTTWKPIIITTSFILVIYPLILGSIYVKTAGACGHSEVTIGILTSCISHGPLLSPKALPHL